MDFILNGNGHGAVAERLLSVDFDTGALRPFINKRGQNCITLNAGTSEQQTLVTNAPASLRKEEWSTIDRVVIEAAQRQLRAWNDLRGSVPGMTMDGFSTTVLQTQTQSDITDAQMDMEGTTQGQADRVEFELDNIPLPIQHKDFQFSARTLAVSRKFGQPLDTINARLAGRKVAEMIERLYLGLLPNYSYAGGKIYGLTNFPDRITFTMTTPTSANHDVTVNEVLQMRALAYDQLQYGPFMLYCSPGWDQYLDEDYSQNKGENTLRARLRKIEGVNDVRTLHFLPDITMLMVQMTEETVRPINGMELRTVQWPTMGGMQLNFKVMAIQVPQLRSDFYNRCGIVHATV